ncbi:MAG: RNA polymerase sigma-70 factor [Prevotellaceae bacterium]|jgi:RNA polymerase sigma-70 factor (ECF subfamily)|nr:RNA polymerase sigma-70 factor [Prevotellaceae bacterium]
MDKKQLDNSQIIIRLRAGDEHFFEVVYKTYFAGLCSFASQYVSLEEAKEIVQETMLWLWENRTVLIPELSLKSLLFTIVKHKSLNRATQGVIQHRVHHKIEEKYRAQFNDPDFYLSGELMTLFNEALQKLPAEYRRAFEMSRFECMTHKEIADRLQVSSQTVNYRIGQALKILRDELKDYLPLSLFLMSLLKESFDEEIEAYRPFFSYIEDLLS